MLLCTMYVCMMVGVECAGGVLLHAALCLEVGGGSLPCKCASQPLQQAQAAGRPHTRHHTGSTPLSAT